MTVIRKSVLLILICIVLGFLLVLCSNMIPTQAAERHLSDSVEFFASETVYPVERYSQLQLDNFSDSIMLMIAAYRGDEPLIERAVSAYQRSWKSATNPKESLEKSYGNREYDEDQIIITTYPRYWHGYQLFLRPALSLLTYSQIRVVNEFVQDCLLLAVLFLLLIKQRNCLFPFLLMILFLTPTAIGKSMHYSSDYYIALLSSLVLLWNPRGILNKTNLWKLFLFAGIATSFLDLLTAPTITLTIPLCILCDQLAKEQGETKEHWKTLFLCAFVWALGYGGMWAGKWLLCWIFLGKDALLDALNTVTYRMSSSTYSGDELRGLAYRLQAIIRNARILFNNRHLLCLTLAYGGITGVLALKGAFSAKRRALSGMALFFFPAVIPLAWTVFAANHSYIHPVFAHRTLAPVIFSVLCLLSRPAMEGMFPKKRDPVE